MAICNSSRQQRSFFRDELLTRTLSEPLECARSPLLMTAGRLDRDAVGGSNADFCRHAEVRRRWSGIAEGRRGRVRITAPRAHWRRGGACRGRAAGHGPLWPGMWRKVNPSAPGHQTAGRTINARRPRASAGNSHARRASQIGQGLSIRAPPAQPPLLPALTRARSRSR